MPAKFLGGDEPKVGAADPYRPVLAKWMTAADNPFFAKAMVNRTWAHLFGRGFVNPVDDMLVENEGHGVTRRENVIAYLARSYRFLATLWKLESP